MQTVVRKLNSSIIDELKSEFVEDGVYTKEVMCKDFVSLMDAYPDMICVLVGYDDDKIVGHLIAYKPFNRSYVVLDQAWNVSYKEHAKSGFEKLKEWVISLGVNEVRFETERASVIARACIAWGFRQHSVILQVRF